MIADDTKGHPGVWRWALWFALILGLTQTVVIFVARTVTDRLVHTSQDAGWMAPVANVALFGIAALVLALTTAHCRRITAVAVCWAGLIGLGTIGPAMLFLRLHPAATVLLIAGISWQSARMVSARAEHADKLIRKTMPALLALTVLIGLIQSGGRELLARHREASLPTAIARAPNVVLIVLDTVRAANLSLYGYARQTTPKLDAFASHGLVFDHALATSSWTLPSHASMMTGRLPNELSANWRTSLNDAEPTLAEALTARGYATVGIVANVLYAGSPTGLNRGFQRYVDYPYSVPSFAQQSWVIRPLASQLIAGISNTDTSVKKTADTITQEFLTWLESRPSGKPFFAFLNYFDAHSPYQPPAPYDTQFGMGDIPDVANREAWTPAQTARSQSAYDGEIAYLDDAIARLVADLNDRQLLDNTLVIITSDHGEQFGEHGLFDHANSLYRSAIEVPLVLSLPGRIPSGERVSEPVSLVDLAATILDLTGNTVGAHLPGASLARHWDPAFSDDEAEQPAFATISKGINVPDWVPISKGSLASVVLDGVHYLRNGDNTEELYDFDKDPLETDNLIGNPGMQERLDAARRSVNQALARRR